MRIFIIIFLLLVIFAGGVFLYTYINRQSIFDTTIDKILQGQLPPYIEIENLDIDLDKKTILIEGFKLRNPDGFTSLYLLEIDSINSSYSYRDQRSILRGISLDDIKLSGASIFLERDEKGALNIEKMESVLDYTRPRESPGIKARLLGVLSYFAGPVKSMGQLLEIDPVFKIDKSALFFKDYFIDRLGYLTTIQEINGTIKLELKKDFKGITKLWSQGRGLVNARQGESLAWTSEYYPGKEKLTIFNTLDMENVDFTRFEPYYDRYSPFKFKEGKAGGRMVFNVDSGQISSESELLFSGLDIEQKRDHSFNRFWPTGADDLYRYFSSGRGEILFDFKIKGPVEEPRFYLGSKTKRALSYMVFDKVIGQIFKKPDDPAGGDGSEVPVEDAPPDEKSRFEKIVDIIKGL